MICKKCGKEFLEKYSKHSNGLYCSKHCAKVFASTFNKKESNKKTSETLKNKPQRVVLCSKCGSPTFTKCTSHIIYCDNCRKKQYSWNNNICVRCGAKRGECKHPSLCRKSILLIKNLEKYFGFDRSCFGSERYYEEIFRIKAMIEEDYFDNQMSITELSTKYGHEAFGNFAKILKSIGIIFRNLSAAVSLNIKLGKVIPPVSIKYKQGVHTTWDNKQVFYRSSYELDYAKELDAKKIKYELETLRIWYFDSLKCIDRTAIPDFYLPETNTIVEIKSSYTYDEQNMKDKFKSYIKHGYTPVLILDHKQIQLDV